MKVLVSGAGGFIGSHMVDMLLSDGHEVIGIDRFRREMEEHREANAKYKKKLKLYKVDINFEKEVDVRLFKRVDWVFHLAAKIGNAISKLVPLEYQNVNVDGTVNMLKASREAGVGRFIYVSTASVYGIPDRFPTGEESEIRLDYPYALTKYIGEQYSLHWWKVYKLPVVVARLFNIYGSKIRKSGNYGPTLSIFLDQKKKGLPLTIRGDGTQKRDFTNVWDVYKAFVQIAQSSVSGEIFNIGNGKAYSMNDLAAFLGSKINYVPFTEKEPPLTLADISKIKSKIGWEPKISLLEGIKRLLEKEKNKY